MASTLGEIRAAFGRGDTNPGFYDAHIPTPGRTGAGNMELALSIADGSFFGWDKPKTSPDISDIPEVLKNLRKSVQGPCCNILTTPEQK